MWTSAGSLCHGGLVLHHCGTSRESLPVTPTPHNLSQTSSLQDPNTLPVTHTPQDQSPAPFRPCFEAKMSHSLTYVLLSGPPHPPSPAGSVTNDSLALVRSVLTLNVILTGPPHPPTPQDQSPMRIRPCFEAPPSLPVMFSH